MKDYTVLDGQITCLRNKLYDEAYRRGYEDKAKEIRDGEYTFYEKGLNDAWECARKLRHPRYGGYYDHEQLDIFGYENSDDVLTNYTAQEAMQKIKDYEERQTEEIKVGDEVVYKDYEDEPMVVLSIRKEGNDKFFDAIFFDGSVHLDRTLGFVVKTGRHFPQIAEVVEQMRKESHEV